MGDKLVARKNIDAALTEYMALDASDGVERLSLGAALPTNWVLVFALECMDEDLDEATVIGWTTNPGAPTYVALGLLDAARRKLRKNT